MLKSEQIKSEVDRLTSELSEKEKLLAEKRMQASSYCQQTESALLDFFRHRHTEIERSKLEKIQATQNDFSRKYVELKQTIETHNNLTYSAWDVPSWSSFDIEKERPAHDATRLGAFNIKGENGSLVTPAIFSILGGKNLLLRAEGSGRQKARQALRNASFRLLSSLPPGKLRFTFIDPVELGSTAAGLIGSLPDFLTGGVAWHEEQDIQDQLSLIETRIAAIKTKYLGIKFSSIEEYNAQAGTIEEPYWLVVISDCPIRFRDDALQRLISIAKNGLPAGVYLAVMLDDAQKDCDDVLVSELADTAHHIVCPDHDAPVFFDDSDFRGVNLLLDAPPPTQLIERIMEQVGKTAAAAQNIKVEWEAHALENWWKGDSRHGLKIPLGTYGARQTQSFEIDEKLLNSALIIGKPGSGKSRLLHVLISGMATRYSPDEVSLYLLDCKQVEFKDYATHKLPHARVVAIESEREFGLSVLRCLNTELDARKTKFSEIGETSLSNYRNKTNGIMPRIVLIVDEFQELLHDDAPGREAAAIFDRLVRLGRALGINVILASQTLSGQTTLLPSTKNQIPIRIVLQCSQSDSILALSQENDEARLLERPGEAIYNSANGRREGNNRFQVSWLSDEKLEFLLDEINVHAVNQGFHAAKPLVIFDGNSLADISQNSVLIEALKKRDTATKKGGISLWLGEPIEMSDSTAAVFKRQSRSNLLMLAQSEYEQPCMAMMLTGIASIAAQCLPPAAQFLVLNLTDPEADWSRLLNECKASFPHQIELITKVQLGEKLNELLALIEKRSVETTPSNCPSIFFFMMGLHRERNLRRADGGSGYSRLGSTPTPKTLSSAEQLSKICRDGPACGIHCVIWCDTFSNFDRVFQRNDIDEFGLRVALQMSESDSRSLIDSDAANRLGSHRAILFDDERNGRLAKFRPYSLMSAEWIDEIGRQIAK